MQTLKPMSLKRFRALAGPSRNPIASFFSKELAWFSNFDESVLGVLILDITDQDFNVVILGRDESKRYRCFELRTSMETAEEAIQWMDYKITEITATGEKIFSQGEEIPRPLELFTPVVEKEKLHPYFKILSTSPSHTAARGIIKEMMPHYVDIDGNFIEQFQTTGFDARVWELYLNAYLTEEELFFEREYHAPDFIVQKYGHTVAIEATIVGRKTPLTDSSIKKLNNLTLEEIAKKRNDEMPIKFGSPLFSKLQKKYWELEHVAGKPLILAIADFHDDQSMLWSSASLTDYLYGVRHDHYHDDDGNLVITAQKIDKHKVGSKEIPSGFFFQPEAENISAVLFSASGTISKFNRLGKQAGFGDDNVRIIRHVIFHNDDPNATLPNQAKYEVTTKTNETWAEGLNMFHNPNAKHPVPPELFPSIAHHRFENDLIISNLPTPHVYSSTTMLLHIASEEEIDKIKSEL